MGAFQLHLLISLPLLLNKIIKIIFFNTSFKNYTTLTAFLIQKTIKKFKIWEEIFENENLRAKLKKMFKDKRCSTFCFALR